LGRGKTRAVEILPNEKCKEEQLTHHVRNRLVRALAPGAAILVVAAVVAAAARFDDKHQDSPAQVTVIYVGADDCAPCRIWRRDRLPKFTGSPEFKRLTYREVTSPKLFDLLNDEHWPDDLRRYRDFLNKTAGVPLWFIVADDKVTLTARGLREWGELAMPKIRSMLHRPGAAEPVQSKLGHQRIDPLRDRRRHGEDAAPFA
jgi:hypothetical protein